MSSFSKSGDNLELALSEVSPETHLKGPPYVRVIRAMDKANHLCFGQDLLEGWEEAIDEFSQAYRDLDISVTPKVSDLVHLFQTIKVEF